MRMLAELCWEDRRVWWLTLVAEPLLVEFRRSGGLPSAHLWAGGRGMHLWTGRGGLQLERDRL